MWLGIAVFGVITGLAILLPTKNATYEVSAVSSTNALTADEVKEYVHNQAIKLGLTKRQQEIADFIIKKESYYCWRNGSFEQDIPGDLDKGISRGCWQISLRWHPEISNECANDLVCSTDWSLKRIKSGYAREWSTFKYGMYWYKDYPF